MSTYVLTDDLLCEDIPADGIMEHFTCGKARIDEYLSRSALFESTKCTSKSKLVKIKDGDSWRCIGFFTLQLTSYVIESEGQVRYPALYLKCLAIDENYQSHGIGTRVLQYIVLTCKRISNFVGCRCLLLDAVTDKLRFYHNRGFEFLDEKYEKYIDHPEIIGEECVRMYFDFRNNELYKSFCE